MEPVAPRVFSNRYELTHLIARGGMAQVYRARDRLLDRPVALKVLFPELSVDRAFVERFRREAQAAANLSQANIVPVFDWGEDGGTYFIVMEFIDGRPLSALLRSSGTLAPERAADIASHVAAALSYAHRHGVVHRDIKPGNVLITDDGQVKVTDFGIARAVNTEESLTQTGAVMGTAAYFSPEQAEGIGVDARSDIYSLGVVLFEMVTGRAPFLGDTPVAVASKHVRDQPPLPTEINPSVPADLEAVVMKAMAKAPDRRYETAADFKADLDRFVEGSPVLAPSPSKTLVQSSVGTTRLVAPVAAATAVAGPPTRTQVVRTPPPRAPEPEEEEEGEGGNRHLWWMLTVLLVVLAVVVVLLLRALGYLGGSSTFAMPNLVGETQSAATATIEQRGLVLGTTHRSPSTQPVGTVTATDPAAGVDVSKGHTVNLTVSEGVPANKVLVPNVVGESVTQAATELNGNLTYRVTPVQSNKPNGQVLAQNPKGGATVPKGTTVVLTVSSQTSTTVPNVVGQSQAAAGNLLAQNSLTVGTVTNQCSTTGTVPNGDVVSSNPAAGTSLPPQSAVALVVSTGPCQIILQNVVGMSQAAATAALKGQSAQLSVVPVMVTNCSPSQNGDVTSQVPTGGTQVSANSSVTIDVCSNTGTTTTLAAPTVTGLSPMSGPVAGGQTVTIHGTGFSTAKGAVTVTFGGVPATSVSCSSTTTCTVVTPPGTGPGPVSVTVTVDGQSATAPTYTYI